VEMESGGHGKGGENEGMERKPVRTAWGREGARSSGEGASAGTVRRKEATNRLCREKAGWYAVWQL